MVAVSGRPSRFDVFLVTLDPTQGAEMQKTRPCVVLSPDEMNHHLKVVIVAPMTTTEREYPTRVPLVLLDKKGQIALDQIRTIDQSRLIKKLAHLNKHTQRKILNTLQEMFKE